MKKILIGLFVLMAATSAFGMSKKDALCKAISQIVVASDSAELSFEHEEGKEIKTFRVYPKAKGDISAISMRVDDSEKGTKALMDLNNFQELRIYPKNGAKLTFYGKDYIKAQDEPEYYLMKALVTTIKGLTAVWPRKYLS